MYVLYESTVGLGVFKVVDEKKLKNSKNLHEEFETIKKANQIVHLEEFRKFEDVEEASMASRFISESKIPKPLKKLLKNMFDEKTDSELMVWDPKLGAAIKEKFGIQVISSGPVNEMMRCIKMQANALMPDLDDHTLKAMTVGVAHNFSRHQVKFSAEKVDTMIVQAISLLDDIDKELNNYIMRGREWYGWHFPELSKIISDHTAYIQTVLAMGMKENAATTDFSQILPDQTAQKVREAAEVSMGTEVSEEDILNIHFLCQEINDLTVYRAELSSYLSNRMQMIAPNLTTLVGELVGARLISNAGSLMNLAKYPASTVQILGAEKALFSAIKARKPTPKYGLIYHASMVGQASTQNKGKVSRMLAAKTSLAARYDALVEDKVISTEMGIQNAAYLSTRVQALEDGKVRGFSGKGKSMNKFDVHQRKNVGQQYSSFADSTMTGGKRAREDDDGNASKKLKVEFSSDSTEAFVKPAEITAASSSSPKKVKKEVVSEETPKKKKDKKKSKQEKSAEPQEAAPEAEVEEVKSKKKKKRDKQEPEPVAEAPPAKKKKDKKKKAE